MKYYKQYIGDETPTEITYTDALNTLLTTYQDNEITRKMLAEEGAVIRKLTPRECWRLMGFDDEDFEKARQVNSDTQLYKQAGNSIVVNVLMAIFGQMMKKKGDE